MAQVMTIMITRMISYGSRHDHYDYSDDQINYGSSHDHYDYLRDGHTHVHNMLVWWGALTYIDEVGGSHLRRIYYLVPYSDFRRCHILISVLLIIPRDEFNSIQ